MEIEQFTVEHIERIAADAQTDGNTILFSLCAEVLQHRARHRGGVIEAASGVSAKTGRGFVEVTWQDEVAQLDPEIAKGLGQSIIDAAYSAEHDAFFIAFLHHTIGLARDAAAAALGELRMLRQHRDEARPV